MAALRGRGAWGPTSTSCARSSRCVAGAGFDPEVVGIVVDVYHVWWDAVPALGGGTP